MRASGRVARLVGAATMHSQITPALCASSKNAREMTLPNLSRLAPSSPTGVTINPDGSRTFTVEELATLTRLLGTPVPGLLPAPARSRRPPTRVLRDDNSSSEEDRPLASRRCAPRSSPASPPTRGPFGGGAPGGISIASRCCFPHGMQTRETHYLSLTASGALILFTRGPLPNKTFSFTDQCIKFKVRTSTY